ncbi:peptidase, partial [Streptomyces regensis]
MTISMIDSASGMNRVLTADAKDRADLIRDMWAPMAGMYHFIPGGVDMATVHQQNFGFRPDSAIEQVREGLESLVAADAWTRIEKALEDGVAALTSADPGVTIPDLNVLLVLGDPTSQHFVDEVQGMSGFGGISGYIAITVWPTSRVLDRLEAIAVHELHHNVRYSPGGIVWDPQTVMVGEHVVSEGLADVFASELYGAAGYTHFVRDETRSDDQVLAKVASGLGVTGMADFAAWVLGDSSAQLFGAEPVGLPTGA